MTRRRLDGCIHGGYTLVFQPRRRRFRVAVFTGRHRPDGSDETFVQEIEIMADSNDQPQTPEPSWPSTDYGPPRDRAPGPAPQQVAPPEGQEPAEPPPYEEPPPDSPHAGRGTATGSSGDTMRPYEAWPSVGRMVHYVARGSLDGHYPPVCRAAVITEVRDVVTIEAERTYSSFRASLCVFNPEGAHWPRFVDYDPDNKPGTWHWPERVP